MLLTGTSSKNGHSWSATNILALPMLLNSLETMHIMNVQRAVASFEDIANLAAQMQARTCNNIARSATR